VDDNKKQYFERPLDRKRAFAGISFSPEVEDIGQEFLKKTILSLIAALCICVKWTLALAGPASRRSLR
jgi:hypothetical protein